MNPEGIFSFKKFAANVYKSANSLHTHFSWIVDSGATDHMCSGKSFFSSLIKLSQPQFIGLPNAMMLLYHLLLLSNFMILLFLKEYYTFLVLSIISFPFQNSLLS